MPDPVVPTPPDTAIKGILDPIQADPALKRAAWDHYHAATDQADFKSRFDRLALPQDAKRALWNQKFADQPSPATPVPATAAPHTWRDDHPWLAVGVDAVKKIGGFGYDLGKSAVEQGPELTGSYLGQAAMAPFAAVTAGVMPGAAPVSVPAIESAGAYTGAYLGRGVKYAGEKVGQTLGMSVPPPPSSFEEAIHGMRAAGEEGAIGSAFAGGFKVGKQLFGTGTLAQKWAQAVAKSMGDVAPTAETAGKRMVGAITQQELTKKAPLHSAYESILQHADEAEFNHAIIGHPEAVVDGGDELVAKTTRELHDLKSKMLDTARGMQPGPDKMKLLDKAADIKDTIVGRLNDYGHSAGDAYQHVTSAWHAMADTQLNKFVTALKKDPSNAVDVFFRKAYPTVMTTVKAAGATARRGMDKDELIGLAQQAMPKAAWNDVKASVMDRALQMSSMGKELRGARLINTLNQIGPDTVKSLFGEDIAVPLQHVAEALEKIQGSTKFELAERFGAIGAAREVIQGKVSRALESIGVPTLMRKASTAPAAMKLYTTIIKDMPQLTTSTPWQRFAALLLQLAKPGETTGMIPPPPQAQPPSGVPAPPR